MYICFYPQHTHSEKKKKKKEKGFRDLLACSMQYAPVSVRGEICTEYVARNDPTYIDLSTICLRPACEGVDM